MWLGIKFERRSMDGDGLEMRVDEGRSARGSVNKVGVRKNVDKGSI